MSRKGMLAVLLGCFGLSVAAEGAVVETYGGSTTEELYSCTTENAIAQTFVVPDGQEMTKVEVFVNDGTYQGFSEGVKIKLFQGYFGLNEWMIVKEIQETSIPPFLIDTEAWVSIDLATPQPAGSYYIQVWTDDAAYMAHLKVKLHSNSNYENGRAAQNFNGTTLLEEDHDFAVRFTTQPVPAKASVCGLRNGDFYTYNIGSGLPASWDKLVESGSYAFAIEPDPATTYVQGRYKERIVAITSQVSGDGCIAQAVDLPPGNYTLTVDVNASSPATAKLSAGGASQVVGSTSGWEQKTLNFSASGQTSIRLHSTGSGTVRYRRASLQIQSLASAAVALDDATQIGSIAIAGDASEAEKFAAYELQKYIWKITGSTPGLAGRDTTYDGRQIIVGKAASQVLIDELDGFGKDAYRVTIDGGNIVLVGNTDRGTLYAAYDFLKTQGCGWYLPGAVGKTIPTSSQLILPASKIESPDYDVRGITQSVNLYNLDGTLVNPNIEDYLDWSLKNRINVFLCGEYPYTSDFRAYRGDGVEGSVGHSWPRFALDAHPEWWALVDGTRTKLHPSGRVNQLCVSKTNLQEFVAQDAIQFFNANSDAEYYALSANDYVHWCECASCRAMDSDGGTGPWNLLPPHGTPDLPMADRTMKFTDAVLLKVNLVHPGKKIMVYAYAATQKPPTTAMVNSNIIINYTWHGAPLNHPISDTNYPMNQATFDELTGWQAAGVQDFWLYDYGNFLYRDIPNFWYYHQADYLKIFNEDWGFMGQFGELDQSITTSMPWFMLRTLSYWDVDIDYTNEINNICQGFYGSAASAMYDYYMFMQQQELDSTIWEAPYDPDAGIDSLNLVDFSVSAMETGKAHLESAMAAAGGDSVVEERIAYARFGHAVMTLEVARKEIPLSGSSEQAANTAYYLARQLSEHYGFFFQKSDLLNPGRDTFPVPPDDPGPNTTNTLNYMETFESYNGGDTIPGINGWSAQAFGDATVTDDYYSILALAGYNEGCGYPVPAANHAKALEVRGTVTNSFGVGAGQVVWVDKMVQAYQLASADPGLLGTAQAAFHFNTNGHPVVYHHDMGGSSNRWTEIPEVTVPNKQWIRLTLKLDYQTNDGSHCYFQVRVDGNLLTNGLAWTSNDGLGTSGGGWFAMPSMPSAMSALVFDGRGADIDDLLVTLNNPLARDVVVASAHGQADPAVGAHSYTYGDNVSLSITNSTLVQGADTFVQTGWGMDGHAPASGSGGNVQITLTNDLVLTWFWTTNDTLTAQGTPVWWLYSYGLTESDDLLDGDFDGLFAWQEWVGDTVPTDSNSVVRITGIEPDGAGMRVYWEGGVQATQWLERCTNLVSDSWEDVFTNEPPCSVTNDFSDSTMTNSAGFYRIRVLR